MTKGTRKPAAQEAAVNGGPIAWVINLLISVKFAVGVVILIALVCIAGTFLPQGAEVDGCLQFREGETKSEFQIENRVKPLPFAVQLAKFEILSDHKRTLVGEAPEKDTHQLVGQWPGRNLSLTSLQVVRDPGVPLVYAGFALLIAGLAIIFYLNPWLESRRAPA